MGKNQLRDEQMTAVPQAAEWSKALVQREARGNGDTENAMHRLEQRYGIPWRTFWSLRYRPPKSICADVWLKMRAAYLAECERQARKLEHEIAITKAIAGADDPVVVEAEALVEAHNTKKG